MRSCHSTRRCSRRYWSGHEPSKRKGRQNTGAKEHLLCTFSLHLQPERLNLSFVLNEFRLELTEEDVGTRLKQYSIGTGRSRSTHHRQNFRPESLHWRTTGHTPRGLAKGHSLIVWLPTSHRCPDSVPQSQGARNFAPPAAWPPTRDGVL